MTDRASHPLDDAAHVAVTVALNDQAFMGARAREPLRVRELIPEFMKLSGQIPGSIVVVNQSSIFARGFDEGRNIDIDGGAPSFAHPEYFDTIPGKRLFGMAPDAVNVTALDVVDGVVSSTRAPVA